MLHHLTHFLESVEGEPLVEAVRSLYAAYLRGAAQAHTEHAAQRVSSSCHTL